MDIWRQGTAAIRSGPFVIPVRFDDDLTNCASCRFGFDCGGVVMGLRFGWIVPDTCACMESALRCTRLPL